MAAFVAVSLALAFSAGASAAQTEQVIDGGFEGTTCPTDTGSCTNSNWPENGKQAFDCRMPPCGPGPASGEGFFTFGGLYQIGEAEGSTSQIIQIPAAPATLSLEVALLPTNQAVGTLTAYVDGDAMPVAQVAEVGSSYEQRTFDISKHVGPGNHELKFGYLCQPYPDEGVCPILNLDNVSVKTGTPDAPPPPPANGGQNQGSTPPETTVTGKPRAKTTQKQAQFSFSSSILGASFECSLDGRGFSSCIAPRIVHVGIGKHVFQVRATASGQTDPTPASYSWKVVKKPHHRHRARH